MASSILFTRKYFFLRVYWTSLLSRHKKCIKIQSNDFAGKKMFILSELPLHDGNFNVKEFTKKVASVRLVHSNFGLNDDDDAHDEFPIMHNEGTTTIPDIFIKEYFSR